MDRVHPWERALLAGFMPLNVFGGFALHIWTTYLAWERGTFLATVLTFALPPFSEAWWFIHFWRDIGPGNWYTVAVAVYAAASIGALLSAKRLGQMQIAEMRAGRPE